MSDNKKNLERTRLRIRTVAELINDGWSTPPQYFDAALVCPSCESVIEKTTIDPRQNESQTEAAQRELYTHSGGFEKLCPECDAALFRNTTVLYDYWFEKEECGKPTFPYTVEDLPIDWNGHDPGPFAAAVLMRYLHSQADFAVEAKHVPWGLDEHLVEQCPLCTTSDRELDFHHWKYDPDIGCALCRECHETIHEYMRAENQSERSYSGSWVDRAIPKLIRRHRLNRSLPSSNASVWEIKHRYNIPFSTQRMESAFNRMYGDCDHEYVIPPNCEDCGEVVDSRVLEGGE